jgi:hypothetical protein
VQPLGKCETMRGWKVGGAENSEALLPYVSGLATRDVALVGKGRNAPPPKNRGTARTRRDVENTIWCYQLAFKENAVEKLQ